MKTFLSATLISMVTASAAQAAAVQFETRAFHSNLRLDAKETTHTINGTEVGTERVHESFDNAAGGGVAIVFNLDEHLDLGLGYSRARYFPGADVRTDQTMISAFSRWTLYQSPATRFYFLAGLTQHDLDTRDSSERSLTVESSITPVMNYDVGLGNAWTFGIANVGLEYKYSNTFGRGNSSATIRTDMLDGNGLVETQINSQLTNFRIEQQELSLSLGITL